jgi:hypothetical protein
LAYREAYGGAVEGKAWNRQFQKLRLDLPWRVGHEIDGITGATLSVFALTKGYRKAARVAQYLCRQELATPSSP